MNGAGTGLSQAQVAKSIDVGALDQQNTIATAGRAETGKMKFSITPSGDR
jgi:hypothetical protein